MGELRASLYDIFGYFLPGLVATAAVRLLLWVCFYPQTNLNLAPLADAGVLTAIAVVAYLVGHLLHAIGNEIPFTRSPSLEAAPPQPRSWRRLLARNQVSRAVIQLAESSIETRFGNAFSVLSASEKLDLLDEARALHERPNEREVYIYREGFYRGITIACAILFICLAASLFATSLTLATPTHTYPLLRSERFVLMLLDGLATYLFWKRMLRFAHYRISRSVLFWLVTSTPKPNS